MQTKLRADQAGFYNENLIINGDFQVSQEFGNTPLSTPVIDSYVVDMWKVQHNGAAQEFTTTWKDHVLGQTAVPGNPEHYFEWDQTTAGTGATITALDANIEDVSKFSGGTFTLSFYAKSPSTITVTPQLIAYFGSGGSAVSAVSLSSCSINSTTFKKYTVTGTMESFSGKTLGSNPYFIVRFNLPLNALFTFGISRAKLEPGSVATESPIPDEQDTLRKCKYYFEKTNSGAYPHYATLLARSTSAADASFHYSQKRVAPTIIAAGNFEAIGVGTIAITGVTGSLATKDACRLQAVSSAGFTAGNAYILRGTGDFTSYITFDSRL